MRDAHIWPLAADVDRRGHLVIAGCDVPGLAGAYGTPLYIVDEATVRGACRAYRTALERHYPGESAVHYAGKALLNVAMARLVGEEGLGLDAVSGGELYVARRAGIPAAHIHLHGNAKPRGEIEAALDAGIGAIVVDNLDELALLAGLTQARAVPQPIMLRFAPGVMAATHTHIQTGHAASKFGLPLDALDAAAAVVRAAPGLRFVGLHAHIGSQIFETGPYEQALRVLLDCAARLRDTPGLIVRSLSPGGGFGVAYGGSDVATDVDTVVAALARTVVAGCAEHGLPLPRLILEPGRSIIARAGIAVYTVVGMKQLPASTGEAARYVHVDGGMGDNIRPALYGARYTALLANRAADPDEEIVDVAGRYCESGDMLLRGAALPRAEIGDFVALAAAGAYTLSMASTYNLVPRPAVAFVRDGRAALVQRRETYDDLLRRDCDPRTTG